MKKIFSILIIFLSVCKVTNAQTHSHYNSQIHKDTTRRTRLFSIAPLSLGTKLKVQYEKVINKNLSLGVTGYYDFQPVVDLHYAKKQMGFGAFARWYFTYPAPNGVYIQIKSTAHYLTQSGEYYLPYDANNNPSLPEFVTVTDSQFSYALEGDLGSQYLIANRVPLDISFGLKTATVPSFNFPSEKYFYGEKYINSYGNWPVMRNGFDTPWFPFSASLNIGIAF